MCPIETPEGPNIGLIGYLALYATVSSSASSRRRTGPSRAGRSRTRSSTSTPSRRRGTSIAQASAEPLDKNGRLSSADSVPCRTPEGEAVAASPKDVELHGRLAGPVRLRLDRPHPVPRAQRREPRAHGREHAEAGRAVARPRSRRSSAPASSTAQRSTPVTSSSPRKAGTVVDVDAEKIVVESKDGPGRLLDDEVHALEPGHAHPPEADRAARRQGEGGPGHRRRQARPTMASSPSARTCSSPSCRSRASTSRTRSSSRSVS